MTRASRRVSHTFATIGQMSGIGCANITPIAAARAQADAAGVTIAFAFAFAFIAITRLGLTLTFRPFALAFALNRWLALFPTNAGPFRNSLHLRRHEPEGHYEGQ